MPENQKPAHPIAKRMIEARTAQGLTMEDLSKIIGVSGYALGCIERGITKNPRRTTLFKLERWLEAESYGSESEEVG